MHQSPRPLEASGSSPHIGLGSEDPSQDAAARALHLVSYEITNEPLPDPAILRLPRAEQDRIDAASRAMLEDPAPLVAELRALVAKHPHIPMLHNHLAGALSMVGMREEAVRIIADLVNRFPRYVFGFSNYIMVLLQDEQVDEARATIETGPRGPLFMLPQFDPLRRVFHVTEVVCYQSMVGHYLVQTSRLHAARTHLKLCRQVYADHPMTAQLGRAIEFGSLLHRTRGALKELTLRRRGGKRKKA